MAETTISSVRNLAPWFVPQLWVVNTCTPSIFDLILREHSTSCAPGRFLPASRFDQRADGRREEQVEREDVHGFSNILQVGLVVLPLSCTPHAAWWPSRDATRFERIEYIGTLMLLAGRVPVN